jgi:hypothetical protein
MNPAVHQNKKCKVPNEKSEKSDMSEQLLINRMIWIVAFIGLYLPVQSQTVLLKAEVSNVSIEAGEPFKLMYTLENGEMENVSLPQLAGLQISGRPSVETSMSIVNGKRSGFMRYTYTAAFEKEGNYTIPPATAFVKGKKVMSNSVKIKVSASSPDKHKDVKGEVFFKAKLTPEKIYLGQQALLSYEIFTSKNVVNAEFSKAPEFEHVYLKPVDIPVTGRNIVINHKNYYTQPIQTFHLYAQKSGKLKLEKAYITYKYEIPVSGNPFFSDVKSETYATNELVTDVLPLPTQNVPYSFSGGVGDFFIKTSADKKTVTLNDALKIVMVIKGDGDPKYWKAPRWDSLKNVEFYEPNLLREESIVENGREFHTKVFEYIVQFDKPGSFILKPKFSYFSPEDKKYVTLEDKAINVEVVPGNGAPLAENDTSDVDITNQKSGFFPLPVILGVLSVLLAGLGYFLFWKKKPKEVSETLKPADEVAKIFLQKAKLHEQKGENRLFFEEISYAMTHYIKQKYGIQNDTFDKENIIDLFKEKNIPESLISTFLKIYATCEFALFAGQKPEMKDILEETMTWIGDMEREK